MLLNQSYSDIFAEITFDCLVTKHLRHADILLYITLLYIILLYILYYYIYYTIIYYTIIYYNIII